MGLKYFNDKANNPITIEIHESFLKRHHIQNFLLPKKYRSQAVVLSSRPSSEELPPQGGPGPDSRLR